MKAIGPVVVVLFLAVPGALSAQREVIEQVLVKVNGDIITKTELEARQIAALRDQHLADEPA
jgi:hypothetical protein